MPTPGGLYVPEEHSVGDIGSEPFIHDRPAGQMRQDDALPRLYLPSGHFCWETENISAYQYQTSSYEVCLVLYKIVFAR